MAEEKPEKTIKINVDVESLGKLKRELATLNAQLEETETGSKAFVKLQSEIQKTEEAVKRTEGAIGDATDRIKTLSGSGVERFNSSIALMREGIQNLDLGKFKIGIQGATQAFGGLKQAIIATGIGALVLLITAIIANFDKLKEAGGAVGRVFTAIGDIVNGLIQGLKDLADWFNITNFAASEAAEAEKKYKESIDESNRSLGESRRRILVATGQLSEAEAERQKLKEDFITNYLKAQEEARVKIKEAASNAEKDVIEKDLKLRLQAISQEYTADLVELNKSIEDKKAAEKKAADEKSKADAEKRKTDAEKKKQDELKASQTFNASLAKSQEESLNQFQKIEADAFNKKETLRKQFEAQSQSDQEKTRADFLAELTRIDLEATKKQEELKSQIEKDEESKRAEEQKKRTIKRLNDDAEITRQIQQERAQDISSIDLELERLEFEGQLTTEKQIELENAKFEKLKEIAITNGDEIEQIELQQQQRLAQIRESGRQRSIQQASALGNALISIASSLSEFGRKSEKQKIKNERNVTLASIALSTGIGIAQAVSDGMKTGVTPIEKGIAIASGIALVLTNIAKARQTVKQADEAIRKLGESTPPPPDLNVSAGGGGGSGGGSGFIAPPTFSLGGQQIGGAGNILGTGGGSQGQQPIKVFVSETDISNVQGKVQVTQGNSLFGGGG